MVLKIFKLVLKMRNYKTYLIIRKTIISLGLLFVFFYTKGQELNTKNIIQNTGIPDYSNLKNWAAHPWKKDYADSIPSDIKNSRDNDSLVDVFFIHPTTYINSPFNDWNASVTDEDLNSKTDQSTILYQASVFNENSSVFAPRYRQAHINSFFIDSTKAQVYFDTAYADIKKSFEYYLEHFNNNKPIIIASHSQGTKHAARLLKEFFENKPLYKKLVCAYIIGMPVPDTYFTKIPPCSHSSQTGCFVAWRTYKKGYQPNFIKEEKFKSVVVNPLTWTMDENLANEKLNKGGVLTKFNKIIPKVVDAQIKGNILWVCKPYIFGRLFIFKKNYHIGDINLFYMNIRENVRERIRSYLK